MSRFRIKHRGILQLSVLVLLSALLISCETIGYYQQAVRGQLGILFSRSDIEALLERPATPAELKQKFRTLLALREFAVEELLLPAGDSYRSYVELNREHVLWNVFAAPEFSLDPVTWCYPIAGCVNYRGYFSQAAAEALAERLARDGYDVYTGGVDAYSTLGWFDDPIYSTVINRPDYQLAELIFHELAHQRVYLPGDTTFNESFATFVEREGTRRWLLSIEDDRAIEAAEQSARRQEQFVQLVGDFQARLQTLFDSDLTPEEKRREKLALQAALRESYGGLKSSWQGYTGYDQWFASSLNNAQLSTVAAYNDLVPAFAALYEQSGESLVDFYQAVKNLAELTSDERELLLQPVH